MNWKDFFYFSRREQQAIVILIVLITGIFVGKYLFGKNSKDDVLIEQFSEIEESPAESKDSTKLVSEPVSQKLSTTYTSNVSSREKNQKHEEKRTYYQQDKPENTYKPAEKLKLGEKIDLNNADSTLLCKIPGIGSAYAKRIVSYRNLLGGYHRSEQLQEVYGMYVELYEKIIPYFTISADSLRTIPVNSVSLDKLKAHPYINFYQAKAIVEIRKKKGKLEAWDELKLLEEFTEEDKVRLLPYLDFN